MSQINVDIIRSRTGTAATCDKGLVVSGVTSSTTFVGNVTGDVTGNVTGNATGLSGTPDIVVQNITGVGATFTGTVSYENIQNLDSVGMVTARIGLNVGPLTGIAATIDVGGNFDGGIVTATSYYGDGSNLSNVDAASGGTIGVASEGTYIGSGTTFINFASSNGTAWQVTAPSSGVATVTVTPGASIGLAIALGG